MLEEAAGLERPQDLVHTLAGATDHLGQLGLGERELQDRDAAVCAPISLGEMHEALRHAAGQVEEHEVAGLLRDASRQASQRAEHRVGHGRIPVYGVEERRAIERDQDRGLEGGRRR